MYKGKKILSIIIARGGSKRLPNKNTRNMDGKPLIAHVVRATVGSKYSDKVIISTDSPKIARIAKKYGAEVPFLRPAELATDTSTALSVLQHAVRFCSAHGFVPDVIVFTKPTSPLVLSEDIDGTIEKMFKTKTTSCFSASEIGERPEWMYVIKKGQSRLFLNNQKTLQMRSQDFPKIYRINGAVYAMTRNVLMKKNQFIDKKPSMFIMPRERSVDIDELVDFKIAEALLRSQKHESS